MGQLQQSRKRSSVQRGMWSWGLLMNGCEMWTSQMLSLQPKGVVVMVSVTKMEVSESVVNLTESFPFGFNI